MRRVRAREQLEDPSYVRGLSLGGYYDLLRDAGFRADEAQELTNSYGWNRLIAGESL